MNAQQIEQLVQHFAKQLFPLAQAGAEEAIKVYQVNAIQHLAYGCLSVIALAILITFSPRAVKKIWDKIKGEEYAPVIIVPALGLFVFIIYLLSLFFGDFLNIWNWVALIHPKLYTAHEIMQSISGGA